MPVAKAPQARRLWETFAFTRALTDPMYVVCHAIDKAVEASEVPGHLLLELERRVGDLVASYYGARREIAALEQKLEADPTDVRSLTRLIDVLTRVNEAPKALDISSLSGWTSTAMILTAQEALAPCTPASPKPPQPTMVTVSPGRMCTALVAAP